RFSGHPPVDDSARISRAVHGQRARQFGSRLSHPDRKEPARLMTAFLALIRKDLKLFLSDPRAVLMSLVAPIAIASFFGYIFGGGAGNGDNAKIPILITNQDGSAITREVINNLAADPSLD